MYLKYNYAIIRKVCTKGGPLLFARTSREKGGLLMDIIKMLEEEQLRGDIPSFNVGDTVQVHYKVVEGSRERVQVYEGTVIKIQGGGARETFTVRRLSYGVGVERTFPLHSPRIEKLVVTRKGKVRRAKLYYLRDRQGKAAKVKEKRFY